MAWLGINLFVFTWIRMPKNTQFIVSGCIFPPPMPKVRRKTIWSELESNLALQAIALDLLRLSKSRWKWLCRFSIEQTLIEQNFTYAGICDVVDFILQLSNNGFWGPGAGIQGWSTSSIGAEWHHMQKFGSFTRVHWDLGVPKHTPQPLNCVF